jgi:hypothetical protein
MRSAESSCALLSDSRKTSGRSQRAVTILYFVHVEYMDYVYGASRVLTVFISVAGPYGGGRPVDPLISLELRPLPGRRVKPAVHTGPCPGAERLALRHIMK